MKAKTKFTRLWSILLALAMVVGMLPIAALAAGSATETADFSTNPTTALALLNDAKTGTTASTWNSDTNTLTLNGVNFTATNPTAVKLPDDAKIVLNGENTIKGGSGSGDCYGIYGVGSLTISGIGTLNVTSGTAGNLSFGIHAQNSVTIDGGAVTATGGAAPNNQSFGIRALYNDLTINGGTVTATGVDAKNSSNGLWAGNGSVTISGGKVVATGGGASSGASSGIYANNVKINNTGAIVTATGGTQKNGHSFGIYAYGGKVTFSSGTLTAATKGDLCIKGTFNVIGSDVKTILFNSNGGVGTMMAKTTAEEYTLPANGFTPPAGMQLKGWSVNGTEKAVGDTITVTDGTTVKAVWENITYTVSFDANGGTGMMTDVTGVLGEYTLPANGFTAPAGKQFKCWSVGGTEKAVGDKITVSANTTVKAVWEDIEYTVTVTNGTASVSKAAAGTTVTLNANDAPSGKVFDKWVVESGSASITLTDENSANTTFTMPAGNVSVKATYKAAPHTHSYGSEWETDANNHWHECTADGCDVTNDADKNGYGEHVYDNDADKTCNTCGYERTVTPPAHEHICGDWQSNRLYHWKVCATCGEKVDKARHNYGTDRTCDICGYVKPRINNSTTPSQPTDTTTKSADTGDMGIALYAGMTILSLTGGAWVVNKKRKGK